MAGPFARSGPDGRRAAAVRDHLGSARIARAAASRVRCVNTDPLELAVYLPCWSLAELAAEQGKTMATALGAVASAAVMTAAVESLVRAG